MMRLCAPHACHAQSTECACTQAIACLILFTFANVLSTLLAKLMASHFHKATHFHKMQEAIRKASSALYPPPMLSSR